MGRRGFGSIRERSSGRFQVRYKGPDGAYHNGPVTFPTKKAAETYLNTIEADVVRAAWRAPATTTEPLADYGRRIIEQRKIDESTRVGYRADWENHIVPRLGRKRVGALSPADVRQWHSDLTAALAEKQAAKTWTSTGRHDGGAKVAQCYRLLRMICNRAVEDELLAKNPCQIKGAGVYSAPKRRVLEPEEVERLAAEVPDRYRVLVLVLAWVQIRLGEAVNLRRDDIDFKRSKLTIDEKVYPIEGEYVIGDPKSDAGKRELDMPEFIADELRAIIPTFGDPDDLVFTTRSGGIAYSAAQTAITRAMRRLGWSDLRLHDLRHTGATYYAQEGATLAELMAHLGHSTVHAALAYQHAASERGKVLAGRINTRRAEVVDIEPRRTG